MIEVWYAVNVTGNASNVVMANFPSVASNAISVVQFSGLATGSPVDVWAHSAYGGSTSATPTTSALTTTVADEVVVAFGAQSVTGHPWSASAGYTLAGQDASDVSGIAYQIVSSLQSAITVSMTSTDSTNSKQIIAVTFNASTGGGGSTTTGFASA